MTLEEKKDIIKLTERIKTKKYDWVKHVITIQTGVVGFLIALHPKSTNDSLNKIYFCTVALIGCQILFGIIYLYEDHSTDKQLVNKILQDMDDSPTTKLIVANPYKVFVYMQYLFFSFFVLSIISLVLYAWKAMV